MTGAVHVVADPGGDTPEIIAVLAIAECLDHPVRRARLARDDLRRAPLLVYHQLGAAPSFVRALADRGGSLAVVHGGGADDPVAALDRRELARAGAIGLATSARAAARMATEGFTRVVEVPAVVAPEALAAVPADPGTANHLTVALHGPLLLTTGEFAAAAAARVVQAYHVLRTYLPGASHLAVAVAAGAATDPAEVARLQREIWGLRLADAWVQEISRAGERAAFVRGARVLVTAEPAQGDTRAALAAMAEGLPVVAPADAAARAVLEGGGVLLPPDAGPALVAEAIATVLADPDLRAELAAGAARVAARHAPARVADAWRAALAA